MRKTATSDIASVAAERALKDARLKPEDIDLIIVATATQIIPFQSTACIVSKRTSTIQGGSSL